MSVEVMSPSGWSGYSHVQFGINRFGMSAPAPEIYKAFEFTPEGIAKRGQLTVDYYKGKELLSPLQKPFVSIQ
ncbi:unnamed protein product [[Candida] boidinii]|nr:unnamed protein product [[Candida] boidinii]